MPIANTMFWYTIERHLRLILMAFEIFNGSSSIKTMSAASIAASEPIAPIAMPMSARPSTGASLMPSPTNASFSFSGFPCKRASTFSTFPAGKSSLYTSSMPSSPATASATFFASPVSMTVLRTPAAFNARTASFACGFTTSEITMWPAYLPSMAMWMIVPTLWHGINGMPRWSMSLSLPAATETPSTFARTPLPLISWMSDTRLRSISLPYARCRLLLIGWEEALSAKAAYSRSFSFSSSLWWMPLTSNTPCVSVPVLSNTTVRVCDSVSR